MDSRFSPSEFLNTSLLKVLSQTFVFRHLEPSHPMLADLGRRRVSQVIFNEHWFPQVGLADPENPDDLDYYQIEDLDIAPDPQSSKPFPSKVFNSYKLRVIKVKLHRAQI